MKFYVDLINYYLSLLTLSNHLHRHTLGNFQIICLYKHTHSHFNNSQAIHLFLLSLHIRKQSIPRKNEVYSLIPIKKTGYHHFQTQTIKEKKDKASSPPKTHLLLHCLRHHQPNNSVCCHAQKAEKSSEAGPWPHPRNQPQPLVSKNCRLHPCFTT